MGPKQFRKSNLVMIGILCLSILSAVAMGFLMKFIDRGKEREEDSSPVLDGAARRERRGQRGFSGFGMGRK